MGRLNSGLIGVFAIGVLPTAATAQTPAPQTPTLTTSAAAQTTTNSVDVSGTTGFDVISLTSNGPGTPLRNGNIVPKSESVQLDGHTLSSGADYMMDYGVGVVYLMVAQKAGQTLVVSYRYKAGAAATGTAGAQFAGLTPFQYALMPGSLNMMAGFGIAERGEDGRAMSSNLIGWNNGFKFGQSGSMNGLIAFGNRTQANSMQGFAADPGTTPTKSSLLAGQNQMIVQNFKSQFLGGTSSFDYQNISRGFTGFQTAGASGMDDASVKQLQAEKGLTRMGYTLNNMQFGGLNFSDSHREVKDSGNGLSWDTMGMSAGGFKLNWGAQNIDNRFNRFKDLEESNKDQLQKETGLNRSYMSGEWAQKFGTLSYQNNKIIEGLSKREITQQIWNLDTSKIKFNLSNEAVDTGFTRFDSLLAPEKTAFGKEAGTQRRTIDMSSSFLGTATPIAFNEKTIGMPGAKYKGDDLNVTSKLWSLSHSERKVDNTFSSIGTMTDAEIDASVKSIAAMYGADIKPTPGDRAEFIATHGLDRTFNGFSSDQIKNWKITGGDIQLKGMTDKAQVDSLTAASKNITFNLHHEAIGQNFTEIAGMMDLEKAKLGMFPGIDRTDSDFAMNTGKRKMDFSTLDVKTQTGTAQRALFDYADPKLQLEAGMRSVSAGFTDSQNLVDPGKDVLNQLRGFNEGDVKLKWQLVPNMTLNSQIENANDPVRNQTWRTQNNVLDWSPDKNTQVNLTDMSQVNTDPIYTLFNDSVEKLSVTRNMGRYGILKMLEEKDEFSGLSAYMASQDRKYLSWDTKITAATSFKTEQTITDYANGVHENINSNTISQDLSKRAGISLNETDVTHSGLNEETHKNYGFWYDIGNGVRVSYGYVHQDLAEDQNTSSSSFTVGKAPAAGAAATTAPPAPGQFGNMLIGAGYFANQWQTGDRTQTNGTLAMSNAKPFRLGWFQDIKFAMNLDTATDHTAMLHENKLVGATTRVGSNIIGYEYKSQMDPTGLRAIDRSVKLTTDPSDKKMLNVAFMYKDRTMTNDQSIIIRDYTFKYRPVKNFLLTNSFQTNPEVANTNVLLGSMPQASSSDKWNLDYKQGPNLTVGGSYQELKNQAALSVSRTAGLNMKLFERSGSPITIFYGMESADQVDLWRTTTRYSIQFDQKPSSDQTLSLLLGSLAYEHSTPIGQNPRSLTLRVNYTFSFK